jgi:hypothetical protein
VRPMHRLILLGGAAGTLLANTPAKPRTACELLSAAEVAAFLKVPLVHIDSLNSGMNEMTRVDFCNWYVKENQPEGVMLKLRRAPSADEAAVSFIAAKVDEEMSPPAKTTAIPGVGDEALYQPYADGKGGTVVVRKGASVVSIIGSPSRETLVAMAKAMVPRL